MMLSIIVTAYKRESYFECVLHSIQKQVKALHIPYETLVINDGVEPGIKELCNKFPDLNITYFFTNRVNPKWRVQCIPLNFGFKQSKGDMVLLHYSDIKNLTPNCYRDMVLRIWGNSKLIATPKGIMGTPSGEPEEYPLNINNFEPMDDSIPFCMAFHKEEVMEIGGFDEDFIGYCQEDRDLMNRLLMNGCRIKVLDQHLVVHLFHEKGFYGREMSIEEGHRLTKINADLLKEREGIIIRNQGRDWGVL